MRILSLDWDYFINATNKEREMLFPLEDDSLSPEVKKQKWKEKYELNPELKEIGVKHKQLLHLMTSLDSIGTLVVSENHGFILEYINKYLYNNIDLFFDVVNVDFHHDLCDFGGDKLNCSNWARLLLTNYNSRYTWVSQSDSDHILLGGVDVHSEYAFFEVVDNVSICTGVYDFVFLCRSDIWSPPHLDRYYYELENALKSSAEEVVIDNDNKVLMR